MARFCVCCKLCAASCQFWRRGHSVAYEDCATHAAERASHCVRQQFGPCGRRNRATGQHSPCVDSGHEAVQVCVELLSAVLGYTPVEVLHELAAVARADFPAADIYCVLWWGGNEAVGHYGIVPHPKTRWGCPAPIGNEMDFLIAARQQVERMASLRDVVADLCLVGWGDLPNIYGLHPVYDWYCQSVLSYAQAQGIMSVSACATVARASLADLFHVADSADNIDLV